MKISEKIEEVNSIAENSANATNINPISTLALYWPLIRICLQFVKIFTNKRADARIDGVIEWGDGISLL